MKTAPKAVAAGLKRRSWRSLKFLHFRLLNLRLFLAAGEVGSPRIFERHALQEIDDAGPADGVGAGAGHCSADDIAPTREKLQKRPCPFPKDHASPDIYSQGAHELGRRAQAPLAAADIHDAG